MHPWKGDNFFELVSNPHRVDIQGGLSLFYTEGKTKEQFNSRRRTVLCLEQDTNINVSLFSPLQVFAMVGVFCFCWTPYAINSMAGILGHSKVIFCVCYFCLFQLDSWSPRTQPVSMGHFFFLLLFSSVSSNFMAGILGHSLFNWALRLLLMMATLPSAFEMQLQFHAELKGFYKRTFQLCLSKLASQPKFNMMTFCQFGKIAKSPLLDGHKYCWSGYRGTDKQSRIKKIYTKSHNQNRCLCRTTYSFCQNHLFVL